MFDHLNDGQISGYKPVQQPCNTNKKLSDSLLDNLVEIRAQGENTSDLVIRSFEVAGVKVALVLCEGMFNLTSLTQIIISPITKVRMDKPDPQRLLHWVRNQAVMAVDQGEVYTIGEVYQFITSGFAVLLIDGIALGVTMAIQGFSFRSISEPSSEVNVRGSREGFVEPLRINMSMVRRRIKSPALKFERVTMGTKSKTDGFLVYMNDVVSPKLLADIKSRLAKINMDIILDTGYVQPFLERRPLSVFSGVGVTERPDTVCAKINEGRVVLILDGTPFALIVPYLFNENFQSFDDYAHRPYYATFIRTLKYISLFFTILLPGMYVAITTFHPELLPKALLYTIASSIESTPFPMVIEALLIHGIYEIMREAGLRLPRPIGHAVSIVGGLVIGDAAVTAGLIGAPMVMVVAITAISSFVVPSLYEPVTILRFAFIIIGGTLGIYGITLGLAVTLINLSAVNSGGIPITAPGSPFRLYSMRDVLIRVGWKQLGKWNLRVQNVPGSNTGDHEDTL